SRSGPHHTSHSFPTRRSSDLQIIRRNRFWIPLPRQPNRLGAANNGAYLVSRPGIRQRLCHRRKPVPVFKHQRIGKHTLIIGVLRSEEHTSELQSRENLVCRLL